MRDTIIGITEFRAQAKKLLDQLDQHQVTVVRHSKPVGILIHPDRLDALLERIEDLEDQVAVLSATGETVPLDVGRKELLEATP